MEINSKNGRTVIDGREFSGRSIKIVGGQVIVDGVEQSGSLVGPVSIQVHGDVERLDASGGSVTVTGSCGHVKTMSGDVHCG